jgi:hypothetical protein
MSLGNGSKNIGGKKTYFKSGPFSSGGNAPVNILAPLISAPYYVAGQTITTTNGTWSGDAPITYSYQWQVSANGVSGWINVGTNLNTILISSGSSQLLFYRCVVTASNGIGSPVSANSNVAGGVDSEANTHFNRVTTDSGVMTYGLIGVDTYIKSIKYIYNISTLSTKFVSLRQLDYLGYKVGSGSGSTAGRSVQTVYSALGASGNYIQTTTTAQPALSAWNQRNFVSGFASSDTRILVSNSKTNPNNTKLTVIIEAYKANTQFGALIAHGTNWRIDLSGARLLRFYFSDGTISSSTTSLTSDGLNGYLRLIVTTSGSDLVLNWATSTDGVNYTAFGSQVTAAGKAGLIGSASQTLSVGGYSSPCQGDYYQAQVFDSTDTLIFNCQPSTYNRAVNSTQFTASTAETYTLQNGTGATGLKNMIVDQTMIQGNGTTMGMQAASLSINTLQFTEYNVWRKFSNAITAGSNGVLKEFGSNASLNQGFAYIPNEGFNLESIYTNSNGGLNGTSWQSNSLLLKVSTFEGDINGLIFEQNLLTNNVQNTFNAVQAAGVNTTAIVSTAQNLFARNNAASSWLNAIWVADALTITTDTSGEKAGIYNLLATESNII